MPQQTMRIFSEPVAGSGVYGDLIYIIDRADPTQTIYVDIWANGRKVGQKRLTGQSEYEVNTAQYIRQFVDVQPQNTNNRTVNSGIVVNDTIPSSSLDFYAGILPYKNPPTDMPRPQESKERPQGVELHWLNPYGALDIYIFTLHKREEVAVRKSKLMEHRQTLRSDPEDAETLQWLAQILASPRVWRRENNGSYRRVEIMTDRTPVPDGRPAQIEIVTKDKE